jgi:hypothetical protein
MTRPRGEISRALHDAAAQQPGTVAQLAHRAQVGEAAARYTVSRMVQRGELVEVLPGRPAVLGVVVQAPVAHADWLDVLQRRFHVGLQKCEPARRERAEGCGMSFEAL